MQRKRYAWIGSAQSPRSFSSSRYYSPPDHHEAEVNPGIQQFIIVEALQHSHIASADHLADSSRRVSLDTLHLCASHFHFLQDSTFHPSHMTGDDDGDPDDGDGWQAGAKHHNHHHNHDQTGHFKDWRWYQMGLGRKQWRANPYYWTHCKILKGSVEQCVHHMERWHQLMGDGQHLLLLLIGHSHQDVGGGGDVTGVSFCLLTHSCPCFSLYRDGLLFINHSNSYKQIFSSGKFDKD